MWYSLVYIFILSLNCSYNSSSVLIHSRIGSLNIDFDFGHGIDVYKGSQGKWHQRRKSLFTGQACWKIRCSKRNSSECLWHSNEQYLANEIYHKRWKILSRQQMGWICCDNGLKKRLCCQLLWLGAHRSKRRKTLQDWKERSRVWSQWASSR